MRAFFGLKTLKTIEIPSQWVTVILLGIFTARYVHAGVGIPYYRGHGSPCDLKNMLRRIVWKLWQCLRQTTRAQGQSGTGDRRPPGDRRVTEGERERKRECVYVCLMGIPDGGGRQCGCPMRVGMIGVVAPS